MRDESDWVLYEQFMEACKNSSLTEDDPVVRRVKAKARKVAWKWADWVDDLIQHTLFNLSKGQYRGERPLDAYIARIMGNFITRLWRREDNNRWAEMPVELRDNRNFTLEIESRQSDRTKRLIAKSPEHLWWYIEAIVDADGYLSEREASKIGKVTRYKVGKLREELRQIWESMESEPEPAGEAKASNEPELTSLAKAKTAGDWKSSQ